MPFYLCQEHLIVLIQFTTRKSDDQQDGGPNSQLIIILLNAVLIVVYLTFTNTQGYFCCLHNHNFTKSKVQTKFAHTRDFLIHDVVIFVIYLDS